ncbi:MAG: hypothetical protein AAB870_03145 [Patescibacteria group bacterium]
MEKQSHEPTNQDILEAINAYAAATDQRFDGIDQRLDKMDTRLTKVESQMVTKEYLDDKLADLRGDILTVIRKEDRRVSQLIDFLFDKKVLSDNEVKTLGELQPLKY